ncbi:MAG TPA: hypothetical protein VE979_14625 [Streptosporangiaceae bacterium]|nr:hypothetical protein [Streptosporangiaceae bacterium]
MTESPPRILADIRDEASSIATEVTAAGLPVRLLGGVAFWLRCPSVRSGPFARDYADLDFAVGKPASQRFRAILEGRGYLPDKFFNGLHGATRLYYGAPDGQWSVDIVIDELTMSHRLDLRGQLDGPGPTLSPADLLLTKLQVWEINRKDLGDAACLLADHGLAAGPAGADTAGADTAGANTAGANTAGADEISLARVTAVLGTDWGFCHTAERNLGKVAELAAAEPVPGAGHDVTAQVRAVQAAIEAAPKSRSWRMRSRIGERVKWYETPEEVRH